MAVDEPVLIRAVLPDALPVHNGRDRMVHYNDRKRIAAHMRQGSLTDLGTDLIISRRSRSSLLSGRFVLPALLLFSAPMTLTTAHADQPSVSRTVLPPQPAVGTIQAPGEVPAALSVFKTACARWEDSSQTVPDRSLAPPAQEARGLCHYVEKPEAVAWMYGSFGAALAIGLLFVVAMIIGMLRVMAFGSGPQSMSLGAIVGRRQQAG